MKKLLVAKFVALLMVGCGVGDLGEDGSETNNKHETVRHTPFDTATSESKSYLLATKKNISGQAFATRGKSGSQKLTGMKIQAFLRGRMLEINEVISELTRNYRFNHEKSFKENFVNFLESLHDKILQRVEPDFHAISDGDGNFQINTDENFIFICANFNETLKWIYPWLKDHEGGAKIILTDETAYPNKLFDADLFPTYFWDSFNPLRRRFIVENEEYNTRKAQLEERLAILRAQEEERLAILRAQEEQLKMVRAEEARKKQLEEFHARKEKERQLAILNAQREEQKRILAERDQKRQLEALEATKEKERLEAENLRKSEEIRLEAESQKLKEYSKNVIKEYFASPHGDHRKVILSNKKITDLSPFANLQSTTFLDLSNNQITDVSHLSNLKELRHLDLSNNQIIDVKPLSTLINLRTLVLSSNYISLPSPLMNLENLSSLDFRSQKWTPERRALRERGMVTTVIDGKQRFILNSALSRCEIKF